MTIACMVIEAMTPKMRTQLLRQSHGGMDRPCSSLSCRTVWHLCSLNCEREEVCYTCATLLVQLRFHLNKYARDQGLIDRNRWRAGGGEEEVEEEALEDMEVEEEEGGTVMCFIDIYPTLNAR